MREVGVMYNQNKIIVEQGQLTYRLLINDKESDKFKSTQGAGLLTGTLPTGECVTAFLYPSAMKQRCVIQVTGRTVTEK